MKKLFYSAFSSIGLLLLNFTALSQNVGIGTPIPDASARLEVNATNKGLLIPRVSLTSLTDNSTVSAPANSLLVFNTNGVVGAGYYFNSGTPASPVWKKLLNTGDAGGGASGWGLTGNADTDTAVNFIGTTNDMPIRIRINNIKSGQLSSSSIFLGDSAGVFTNETKSFRNIAIGRKTMLSNDSGSYNVALGSFALSSAFGDAENVAIGDAALSSSDDYYGSGGGINTAVGSSSLQDLIDGQYNTALGGYSMISNWSGFANTAIGTFADCLDTLSLIDVNNATAIGFGALADVDNMIKLGDENVTDVLSNGLFSTISDGRFKKDIKNENGGLDFIMQLRPVNYHYNVQKMIDAKIKTLSARHKNSRGFKTDKTASMLAWYNSPAYKKKTIENESRLHNGFIAQEVEVAANKVGYNFSGIMKPKNANGRYALSYATFVVPLVEAVQQQQKTIEEQNKKIDALVKRLEILEQK